MGLVYALIIGGIVGWLAAAVMGRKEGIFGSVAIGIIGAIIGSLLASLFSPTGVMFAPSWAGIVWTFIGAIILVAVLNGMQSRTSRRI